MDHTGQGRQQVLKSAQSCEKSLSLTVKNCTVQIPRVQSKTKTFVAITLQIVGHYIIFIFWNGYSLYFSSGSTAVPLTTWTFVSTTVPSGLR